MKLYLIIILALLVFFPRIDAKVLDTVTVNFEIKDSSGNPLENALIIINGITNTQFSNQLLTDSNGKASITLNKNEIFVYIIYKFTYTDVTNNFFTSGNKDIKVALSKVPADKWYFYYINNGEIELKFKSLDLDTNYSSKDSINEVLDIKNLAGKSIDLIKEKTSLETVDSLTLKRLRWWGDLRPQNVLIDLTLKKDGWFRATIQDDVLEVCAGNAVGTYKGQAFDVSGSEFICKNDKGSNIIPDWILKNNYKFKLRVTYKIDGNEKNLDLLTQDFFIDNIDWKPEISSFPSTKLNVNEDWSYNITPKYPTNFVYYKLEKAPNGMSIDNLKGILKWKPDKIGYSDVIVRAYYPYFDNDDRIAYNDQKFTLEVIGKGNLYANNLYVFNKNVKINENIKVGFKVYNDDYKPNSFSYRIYTDNINFISYKVSNMKPYEKRTVYTQLKYNYAGTFIPKLIIDSDNEVDESNEQDNIKFFDSITVKSSIIADKKNKFLVS
ncbi:MAG: CARDB domain-containing protein [Nanoarchaeota archaeon]